MVEGDVWSVAGAEGVQQDEVERGERGEGAE